MDYIICISSTLADIFSIYSYISLANELNTYSECITSNISTTFKKRDLFDYECWMYFYPNHAKMAIFSFSKIIYQILLTFIFLAFVLIIFYKKKENYKNRVLKSLQHLFIFKIFYIYTIRKKVSNNINTYNMLALINFSIMILNTTLFILIFTSNDGEYSIEKRAKYTQKYKMELKIINYPGVIISMITSIISFLLSFYKLCDVKKISNEKETESLLEANS
jgi:hypothetical protein